MATTPKPPLSSGVKRSIFSSRADERLRREKQGKNQGYTEMPTMVEFTKLETEVKHIWRYVALAASVIGFCLYVYTHLDNKITNLDDRTASKIERLGNKIDSENKYLLDKFENLNNRVDSLIFNSKPEPTANNQE